MVIRIARGTPSRILASAREGFDVVLRVTDVADPEAATEALDEEELFDALSSDGDGPHLVQVMPTPDGPVISIDAKGTPRSLLKALPDMLAERLSRAGIPDATISAGETVMIERRLPDADGVISLRVYPPPPPFTAPPVRAEVPDEWLSDAAAFLDLPSAPTARLWAGVDAVSFELPAESHLELLHRCRATNRSASLARVDADGHVRAAHLGFGSFMPNLVLAEGRPAWTDAEIVGTFQALRSVCRRRAAQAAYGFISIDKHLRYVLQEASVPEWAALGGAIPFDNLCDEIVFDAYPYQVLGPGHLRRLGEMPAGAVPLEEDGFELELGEITSWMVVPPPPDDPRASRGLPPLRQPRRDLNVQEWARERLRPCLLSNTEAYSLLQARRVGMNLP